MNEEVNWKLMLSVAGTTQHTLMYQAEFLSYKIKCEICTPVKKNGEFGKAKRYYYIIGDKREFETLEALKEAIKSESVEVEGC